MRIFLWHKFYSSLCSSVMSNFQNNEYIFVEEFICFYKTRNMIHRDTVEYSCVNYREC